MFKQSRAIAYRNWARFMKRTSNDSNESSSSSSLSPSSSSSSFTVVYDDSRNLPSRVKNLSNATNERTVHDLLFELHALRMHDDLWRAAERDPLGTVYSAAWTLCSSLPPPREILNDPNSEDVRYSEYYANWFPFVLLHRYTMKLRDRVNKSINNNNNNNDNDDTGDNKKQREEELELFTVEQLIEADRRYVRSFDELREVRDDPRELRRLYALRENEYLASETFQRMAIGTPFGCAERINVAEIAYVDDLRDVRRKRRLTNLFRRNESYDRLRGQCESKLRALFKSYVTATNDNNNDDNESFRLNCWLLSMLRRDEDTNDFVDDNEDDRDNNNNDNNERDYVVYWQYQKSEIVWFVMHALFALNDSVRDDRLTRDLLYYVGQHLERLIECGVCSEHWKRHGAKLWRMYDERYAFVENGWRERARSLVEGNTSMENMWKVLSYARVQSQVDPTLPQPDLYMLHTHNSVQGDNVSSRKRLTRTCVEALRVDYALYALLIEATIGGDRRQVNAIKRLTAQRDDVLSLDDEIYLESMVQRYVTDPTMANVATNALRKCRLNLEHVSILNVLHGRTL